MPDATESNASPPPPSARLRLSGWELAGVAALLVMVAWYLHASWRKWVDPIIDGGPQLYATWQVSQGAMPYHNFDWNYGPLSLATNGLLFSLAGTSMMTLVTANLIIYAGILGLAYAAFRRAWGARGAFAACAVFIAVFSFSILNSVGNYNFAMPYSEEVLHGTLLLFLSVLVTARWVETGSEEIALALGLCGGTAIVLKPEFMLALVALGLTGLACRWQMKRRPPLGQYSLMAFGAIMPAVVFTIWFAKWESWREAWLDANHAWETMFGNPRRPRLGDQSGFLGFTQPLANVTGEARAALAAVLVLALIWAAAWALNRPWRTILKWAVVSAALVTAASVRLENGWLGAGRALPGLMILALCLTAWQAKREIRRTGTISPNRVVALLLVVAGGVMMARMPLRARLDHFGFFQAALAGMVVAACAVAEVPRWAGSREGKNLAAGAAALWLAAGCWAVTQRSNLIHSDQTQVVAAGGDRFYAFAPEVDGSGYQINWCVDHLRNLPGDASLQVIPEGSMVNYLARRIHPLLDFRGSEEYYVKQLSRARPDYVVFLTRDLREYGIERFGAPGNQGELIMDWLRTHYFLIDQLTNAPRPALILKRRDK